MVAPHTPRDRQPAAKPRVRRSTPKEIDQTDAVRAEVDSELSDGYVVVPIAGVDITVPPAGQWRSRSTGALRVGDFEAWAEAALAPEDYARWQEADPTNDEVNTFFDAWGEVVGAELGESRASRRASVRTARP